MRLSKSGGEWGRQPAMTKAEYLAFARGLFNATAAEPCIPAFAGATSKLPRTPIERISR
jgi:hypothetical protein